MGRYAKKYSQAERIAREMRLLASRKVTVNDLAAELGITRRQAYRDLQRIEEEKNGCNKENTMGHQSAKKFIRAKNIEFKKSSLVEMKDIMRKGKRCYRREDWILMKQSSMRDKVFLMEKLRNDGSKGKIYHRHRDGEIRYRLGYYIVGRNGRAKGKWVWGQFCPMIPQQDLRRLIKRARKKRWLKL